MTIIKDQVSLTLAGETIFIAESYSIDMQVFTQPCTFSLTLGYGGVVSNMIKRYPPNTPFVLTVSGARKFIGFTDGYAVQQAGDGTTLTLTGRDQLARLVDYQITREQVFSNITYVDLIQKAFVACDLPGVKVIGSNSANRKVQKGGDTTELTSVKDITGELIDVPTKKQLTAKTGEQWLVFLKRHLDRVGLFLWASVNENEFIVSAPNAKQTASYRILRQRGQPQNAVNVLSVSHTNNIANRHGIAVVYGRGGGGKFGRAGWKGDHVSEEMVNTYGRKTTFGVRDSRCGTQSQADYLAYRKLSEEARDGWQLSYMIAGHTVPTTTGGSGVWTTDTVVSVDDQELGLRGNYYLEGVRFDRSEGNGTTTTLKLMRSQDLIFSDPTGYSAE